MFEKRMAHLRPFAFCQPERCLLRRNTSSAQAAQIVLSNSVGLRDDSRIGSKQTADRDALVAICAI